MEQPKDYPKPIIVFVYGSLKRGLYNYSLLSESNFISKGETLDRYGMLDIGSFPGLNKEANVSTIKGELFEVTEEVFQTLDRLEGYPTFYTREMIQVDLGDATISAWCYFISDPNKYSSHYVMDGVWTQNSYDRSEYLVNPYAELDTEGV